MKKVLIIGAARSGMAAAKLLLNHGYKVSLTDTKESQTVLKSYPELTGLQIETLFGEQLAPEKALEYDFIVPSPGVPDNIPLIREADRRGIPVLSEPEIAYRLSKTPFVAITGTNGKTTTTTLTGEIFKNSGRETRVVGNIGDPVSAHVDEMDRDGIFVTEIGSFQLDRTKAFKPVISLILNITPDHLDRHRTMENYIGAKAKIFANQDEGDYLILNQDDNIVKNLGQDSDVTKFFISTEGRVDRGAYLDGDMLRIVDGKEIELVSTGELGIKGLHNVQNALGASLIAYLSGVSPDTIRESLKAFKGVPHRQEPAGEVNGVSFINDSKGTNTDAAIIALEAMRSPVILIAGGYDKHEDYTRLAEKIKSKCRHVVLLGQTREDIKDTLDSVGYSSYSLADSFRQAFDQALSYAESGDTVLLSPACASWGMFNNYEERGDLFKELVKELE